MKTYALLCHPGLNRIYARQAAALCAREIWAAAEGDGLPVESVEQATIAGVDYLLLNCRETLSEGQLRPIARLSAFFALFEMVSEDILAPVAAESCFAFPDDIVTQLKYKGKTNERFTHLMVNLGRCASRSRHEGRLRLLDPLCGKGTTLFTAMRFGMDSAGIDTRESFINEGQTFLERYLETGRFKHKRVRQKMFDRGGRKTADITSFSYAADKAAFRRKDLGEVKFIHADTLMSKEILPRKSFDLLVTDLPYGVQHRSRSPGKSRLVKGSLSCSAVSLVNGALDGWLTALKPGASLVFAFNTLSTPAEDLLEIFSRHGADVLTGRGYTGYFHRVDQSIARDLIVARKPE